jgi:hypothetical protein
LQTDLFGEPVELKLEKSRSSAFQPDFFGERDHPIVVALRGLEISRLTPLQAMQALDELIRAARGRAHT